MSKLKTAIIIPARYASLRFPGKLLKLLNGKPVLQWVYECLKPLNSRASIIIATDDNRIKELAISIGAQYVMTSPDHKSGTDRCAEVAQGLSDDIIINVQGDEPFIDVEAVNNLIDLLSQNEEVEIATLMSPLVNEELIKDRNTVKVVTTTTNKALYFSRSIIPSKLSAQHYKHIGVYGFKRDTLLKLAELAPSELELSESLEQLRWLENDYSIYTELTDMSGNSIDTPADLQRAEKLISEKQSSINRL